MALVMKDKVKRIFSSALLTAAKAYPFYLLINRLSQLDIGLLRPCNDECTFIRYWGTKDMPRTAMSNSPWCKHHLDASNCTGGEHSFPVFMTIANGWENITFSQPNDYQHAQQCYTNLALFLSELSEGGSDKVSLGFFDPDITKGVHYLPALCHDMSREEMRDKCNTMDMKELVVQNGNHLTRADSYKVYLFCIVFWAFFHVLHDWLIIGGGDRIPEMCTLIIGYMAVFFQIVALTAGFFWSIGAAEVFVTEVPGYDEEKSCGCYYEMDTLPMFGVIATPVALYMLTRNKVWKMFYAVLHGDYLYSVSYSVPYRTAERCNKDPTYEFLQSVQEVAGGDVEAPRRRFLSKHYRVIYPLMNISLLAFNVGTMYYVYAFAFPSLTVRFYDVVIVSFVKSGVEAADAGAYFFLAFSCTAPLYAIYGQMRKAHNWWYWSRHELKDGFASLKPHMRYMRFWVQWMIPMMQQSFEVLLMTWWALISYRLPYLLMNATEITAESAGEVGAAGFYLWVSFLNAWVPSDTPYKILQQAVLIKGGKFLPIGGFVQLEQLNKDYAHLGLQNIKKISDEFLRANPGSRLKSHGVTVTTEELKEWVDFATPRLDGIAQGMSSGSGLALGGEQTPDPEVMKGDPEDGLTRSQLEWNMRQPLVTPEGQAAANNRRAST